MGKNTGKIKTCPSCGREFAQKHTSQIYCDTTCRKSEIARFERISNTYIRSKESSTPIIDRLNNEP